MGIRPILNVPGFGEVMIATYLTFLAPDELDAILRVLDPRLWLARLGLRLPVASLWRSTRAAPRCPESTSSNFHSNLSLLVVNCQLSDQVGVVGIQAG